MEQAWVSSDMQAVLACGASMGVSDMQAVLACGASMGG